MDTTGHARHTAPENVFLISPSTTCSLLIGQDIVPSFTSHLPSSAQFRQCFRNPPIFFYPANGNSSFYPNIGIPVTFNAVFPQKLKSCVFIFLSFSQSRMSTNAPPPIASIFVFFILFYFIKHDDETCEQTEIYLRWIRSGKQIKSYSFVRFI